MSAPIAAEVLVILHRALGGIDLLRRAVADALVLPFLVLQAQPAADSGRCFGNARIGVQLHLLILQAAPQPLLAGVPVTIQQDRWARVPGTPHERCTMLPPICPKPTWAIRGLEF